MTEPVPPNRKKQVVFLVGVTAAVFLVAGIVFFFMSLGTVTTDDAYIEGRIHSIASKIPGTVKEVFVDDNQNIKKGDALAEIDPADYEVRSHEAEAALDAEKARLSDAEAGIKTAEANLEVQTAASEQALRDKNRAEALFNESVIPKERQEKALTAYTIAAAQAKAATEQLGKAKTMRELETALVTQREAALEAAKLNLGYTKITAPTDGFVTKKSVEVGNQIQPGQPLMAVVALDDIWVSANFKETQLKNVRPGQPVKIKIDTYPGKVFTGKVDSIMAGTGAAFSLFPPENALGNYVKVVQRITVKIAFDSPADARHVLRIGMSCIPTIYTRND